MTVPYRDFLYPLNALMHVLVHEEGDVPYLHYGLFESPGEPIAVAQERSTRLLLDRLPPPPARLLEAGSGLGTTLRKLIALGYEAEGITPDQQQIEVARATHDDSLPIHLAAFENWSSPSRYDLVIFQESSQYIDSGLLFTKAAELTDRLIVLDEFALKKVEGPGALHSLEEFLKEAERSGFKVVEDLDLSTRAAPTVQYFLDRLPRYRTRLVDELGLSDGQIDELIASGERYRERYRDGSYGYRLLVLQYNSAPRELES